MKAPRNGIFPGQWKTPHCRQPNAGKPLGRSPIAFTRPEKTAWYRLAAERADWIDYTHRRYLRKLVRATVELDNLKAYFGRREKRFLKAGKPAGDIYLSDKKEGAPHPRAVRLQALEDILNDYRLEEGRLKEDVARTKRWAAEPANDNDRFFR